MSFKECVTKMNLVARMSEIGSDEDAGKKGAETCPQRHVEHLFGRRRSSWRLQPSVAEGHFCYALKRDHQHTSLNRLLAACVALALMLGIPSAAQAPTIFSVKAVEAEPRGPSELTAPDLDRARLIDLIDEFDAKIEDINQKNPEMARINAQSFSGGHMNRQSGQMEDKFGRVTPSNTVRNGLLGSATNTLLMTALLTNLLRNQQGNQQNDPGAKPEATPSAVPTPTLTATPTPTVTPTPTPQSCQHQLC